MYIAVVAGAPKTEGVERGAVGQRYGRSLEETRLAAKGSTRAVELIMDGRRLVWAVKSDGSWQWEGGQRAWVAARCECDGWVKAKE